MNKARRIINDVLGTAKAPAVLWSGGLRSTLTLKLAREVDESILVIWFYSGLSKEQKRFNEQVIMDWDLNVYSWHPASVCFSAKGLVFEYAFGQDRFPVLLNMKEGEKCLLPERYTQSLFPEFDVLLSGHGDTFPESPERLGNAKVITPTSHLTESEVWNAIKELNIPYENKLRRAA